MTDLKGVPVFLVLDNHSAHHSHIVKEACEKNNFILKFMPSYSPELNCIESLWSLVKRDWKKRLAKLKFTTLHQADFVRILQETLDAVTPAA